MSITDLADLSPSARRTAEEFLSTTPADLRDDLRAHLLDSLSPRGHRRRRA